MSNPMDILEPMLRQLAADTGYKVDEPSLTKAREYLEEMVPLAKHRNSRSLAAYRAQVTKAINYSTSGSTGELPLGTLQALIEIIDQLIHIERNLEGPDA